MAVGSDGGNQKTGRRIRVYRCQKAACVARIQRRPHTLHEWRISTGSGVDLRSSNSPKEFAERIRAFAEKLPKGRWIKGGDWDHERWPDAKLPTKESSIVSRLILQYS